MLVLFCSRAPKAPSARQHGARSDLCQAMQSLSITHRTPSSIPKRWFHSTSPIFQDKHHLDDNGYIKQIYLAKRKQFLQKNHLLQDRIKFKNHVVYQNLHLYDFEQVDLHGKTNLQRMQQGICPITVEGKDYLTIHHFDQTHDGDWIILPHCFHEQYDRELHSNIRVKNGVIRHVFAKERQAYWRFIAQTLEKKATLHTHKL
ncbi:MAG TPA: HNH/ENDO VII family nuclease [Candidatus Berkiella sp.]|nr:HNH/ENDO VII family nuclease [Candidatus Berkiella sp.]